MRSAPPAGRWCKTTVLPFGLSGYISGAMLGLGRALGETIALLIILRGTQQAFGWSLFDAGYTFASKIAAAASEFNDQYKAGAYIAAGLVLFILTFVVNSLARAAVAGRSAVMTSTLDQPVKAPTFQGVSLRRKVTNNVATVLVTLSVVDRGGAPGVGALHRHRQGHRRRHVAARGGSTRRQA